MFMSSMCFCSLFVVCDVMPYNVRMYSVYGQLMLHVQYVLSHNGATKWKTKLISDLSDK